ARRRASHRASSASGAPDAAMALRPSRTLPKDARSSRDEATTSAARASSPPRRARAKARSTISSGVAAVPRALTLFRGVMTMPLASGFAAEGEGGGATPVAGGGFLAAGAGGTATGAAFFAGSSARAAPGIAMAATIQAALGPLPRNHETDFMRL